MTRYSAWNYVQFYTLYLYMMCILYGKQCISHQSRSHFWKLLSSNFPYLLHERSILKWTLWSHFWKMFLIPLVYIPKIVLYTILAIRLRLVGKKWSSLWLAIHSLVNFLKWGSFDVSASISDITINSFSACKNTWTIHIWTQISASIFRFWRTFNFNLMESTICVCD